MYNSQQQEYATHCAIISKPESFQISQKGQVVLNTRMPPGIVIQIIQVIPDKSPEIKKQ